MVIDVNVDDYVRNVTVNNFLENGVALAPNFNPGETYFPEAVAVSPGLIICILA